MCKFQVSLIIYFSCKIYFCLLNPVTFFLFLLLGVSLLYLLDSKLIYLLIIETLFHLVNLGPFFTIVFSVFCVQIPGHLFICFWQSSLKYILSSLCTSCSGSSVSHTLVPWVYSNFLFQIEFGFHSVPLLMPNRPWITQSMYIFYSYFFSVCTDL